MVHPELRFLLLMYHARPITEALRNSPSLRVFRIPRADAGFLIVQGVSRNPALKEIRSMRPRIYDSDSVRFFELHGSDHEISRRLVFPEKSEITQHSFHIIFVAEAIVVENDPFLPLSY